MVTVGVGVKMRMDRHCPRIDAIELKNLIVRRLGQRKAQSYFDLISMYLRFRLTKSDFDKFCFRLLGRENISLHNGLIRAIMWNACIGKYPPTDNEAKWKSSLNVKVPNGYRDGIQWQKDVFSISSRKGRTPSIRDCMSKDQPSFLEPRGKLHSVSGEDSSLKFQEQQSVTEILSLGSRPLVEVTSVEEGEEVEQFAGSPVIHSRSSLRAPLGVYFHDKASKNALHHGSSLVIKFGTCYNNAELPDTHSLRKLLEQKLGMKSLKVSSDCVNLLNNGLDVFLKRLLKPCLYLADSRSEFKVTNKFHHQASVINGMGPLTHVQMSSVSITDFLVTARSNPQILGEVWLVQLEKACFCAPDHLEL